MRMSHIGDTSNPTPDSTTPGSTSRSRVASESSVICGSSVKKLKFNEHGLPVGEEDSAKSSSRLGHLARTHIPISYMTWTKVPARYKDQLWTIYMGEYRDLKNSQREVFMKKANDAWKKFKSKLRATLVGNDISKWKEHVPVNIKSEDWEMFCDHEASLTQQELRKRNKAIKASCPRKSTHNTGRDGYARAAERWKEKHGHYPTRAELWLETHKVKGGDQYAPHDKEFAEKVKQLLQLFQESGEEETLDCGPLYETFGKETKGRVRCIGSTISRKVLMASAFAREMLKEVTTDRDDWMKKVDIIREEVGGVKSIVTEFINDLKNGKFVCGGHNSHTTPTTTVATPTSVTHDTTSQFPSSNDLISCKILSYSGDIIGYGRKTELGVVGLVHGHCLGPREVRVIVDKIKVHDSPLWGGTQGCCSMLTDVGLGGFLYWHDDLLPSTNDTDEE